MGRVEALELRGVDGGDRLVAEVLAHDRSVFALHQGVVGGAMRPRLGELPDQQLVEQLGHPAVEKLRAAVGVKAADAEGELVQDGLQNGDQMGFRDGLATAHHLPLRHRIDGIDVVQPGAHGGVALMHRVDPQVAGPPARVGPPPLADGHRAGARPGVMDVVFAIDRGASQVVDVRGREGGQSLQAAWP